MNLRTILLQKFLSTEKRIIYAGKVRVASVNSEFQTIAMLWSLTFYVIYALTL